MTESRSLEVDDFNGKIIAEFRANGGKVGGPFQRADILLLHPTGARSGEERVSPLSFLWAGESLAVFASLPAQAAQPRLRQLRGAGGPAQDPRGRARSRQMT